MHDPIALAVPFFFVLIGLELAWARRRRVSVYRFTDAITDLSCGITSQVVLIAWAAAQLVIFTWVYEHARLVTLPGGWIPWAVAFVGVDFCFYWWHRLSHEVNLMWAAHVVHHQSEDFNLAVALRQAVLTSWTAFPFYLPLAVLGVPPLVFAVTHALSLLYQFWIHTELVGKVEGPIARVLNLPSHHRVHHAINPEYLDRNYGGTLIVWDRLFGTFIDEDARPVYGITKPLRSFDPIWAQVHYWVELVAMSRACSRPADKIRCWFASPAWKPPGAAPFESGDIHARPKYDREISRALARYLAVQYAIVVGATFSILMWHHAVPASTVVLAVVAILGALVAFGALIERRSWAVHAEATRIVLGVVAAVVWLKT